MIEPNRLVIIAEYLQMDNTRPYGFFSPIQQRFHSTAHNTRLNILDTTHYIINLCLSTVVDGVGKPEMADVISMPIKDQEQDTVFDIKDFGA